MVVRHRRAIGLAGLGLVQQAVLWGIRQSPCWKIHVFTIQCVISSFAMATAQFTVRQDEQGIYHVEGEVSIHDLEEFRSFLEGALKGGREITMSLSGVKFIDTAALQLLLAFKRRLEPRVSFHISAVSPEVEDILSLCGLRAAIL